MKKVIITIIMIVIVFECIPIISKAIYGEEQKVFNAMPGDVVVGTDENGKFITKPHDTGSVVKSADNTKAKSLRVYMDTYHPVYAVKLSAKNFGTADDKMIIPLYAAFCL